MAKRDIVTTLEKAEPVPQGYDMGMDDLVYLLDSCRFPTNPRLFDPNKVIHALGKAFNYGVALGRRYEINRARTEKTNEKASTR